MKQLSVIIETLEPVRLHYKTEQGGSVTEALSYLSGAAIRGAVLKALCLKPGKPGLEESDPLYELLLQKAYFRNAYPYVGKRRLLPLPLCYRAEKAELYRYDESEGLPLYSMLEQEEAEEGKPLKPFSEVPFAELTEGKLRGYRVRERTEQHGIQKNGRMRGYRYTAIDRGQRFASRILLDEASCEEPSFETLQRLLSDCTVYLGGAKGSGYGRCRLSVSAEIIPDALPKTREETLLFGMEKGQTELDLYFLSDAVFSGRTGAFWRTEFENRARRLLQAASVTLEESVFGTKLCSGYNGAWQCARPSVVGVKAGSVCRMRIKGVADKALFLQGLRRLSEEGIGIRRKEGFGELCFVPPFSHCMYERLPKEKAERKALFGLLSSMQEENREQLRRILSQAMGEREIERRIMEDVQLTNAKTGIGSFQKINLTQLGVLLHLIEETDRSLLPGLGEERKLRMYEALMYFFHSYEERQMKQLQKQKNPYKDSVIVTKEGRQTMEDYLSSWFYMTDEDLFTRLSAPADKALYGLIGEKDHYALRLRYVKTFLQYLMAVKRKQRIKEQGV